MRLARECRYAFVVVGQHVQAHLGAHAPLQTSLDRLRAWFASGRQGGESLGNGRSLALGRSFDYTLGDKTVDFGIAVAIVM